MGASMILKEINIIVRELEVICQGLDCKLLANDNLFNLAPRAAWVAREKENNARLAIAKWVPTMLAHLKVSMWGFLNGGHW